MKKQINNMAKCFIKQKNEQTPSKDVFKDSRDIIEYNFSILDDNNVEHDYYSFEDFNNVPCERGFQCLAFYNELSMRCTRDYLNAFSAAFDNILNATSIKLTELFKLNLQMKERLEMLHEPEIAYKLCSVVFFDKEENPYRFDYKHGLKKADLFMKTPINDFFFQEPVVKLLPYISSWSNDLQEYCMMINQIKKKQIQDISTMLSDIDKNKEYYKSLESLLTKDLV